jgi:hypothetical protein
MTATRQQMSLDEPLAYFEGRARQPLYLKGFTIN